MNPSTDFYDSQLAGQTAMASPTPPSPHELVVAFSEEIQGLRSQIYSLDRRLSRYDRGFERLFQEELDSRVNGNANAGQGCVEYSKLSQLRDQVQKAQYAAQAQARGL